MLLLCGWDRKGASIAVEMCRTRQEIMVGWYPQQELDRGLELNNGLLFLLFCSLYFRS